MGEWVESRESCDGIDVRWRLAKLRPSDNADGDQFHLAMILHTDKTSNNHNKKTAALRVNSSRRKEHP